MYGHQPYKRAAIIKFGVMYDPAISGLFDTYHAAIEQRVAKVLDTPWSLRGELFPFIHEGLNEPEPIIQYVGTPYYLDRLGKFGSFIVHTLMPQGLPLESEDFELIAAALFDEGKKHSIAIDFDDVTSVTVDLPVWYIEKAAELPLRLLSSDVASGELYGWLKDNFDGRIRSLLEGVKPKWGPEAEGYVLHFPDMPVKVMNPKFYERKTQNGW